MLRLDKDVAMCENKVKETWEGRRSRRRTGMNLALLCWPEHLSQLKCVEIFFSFCSATWQRLGDVHFVSACGWWRPGAWAWPVVTQGTAARPAVTMTTLQAQGQTMTPAGTAGTVVMKRSPSPRFLLWAGSGIMSIPRTWWPSGFWLAGFVNSVSPKMSFFLRQN